MSTVAALIRLASAPRSTAPSAPPIADAARTVPTARGASWVAGDRNQVDRQQRHAARIRPGLTPLAATGLVALMIGATVLTPIMIAPDPIMTSIPATLGLLAAFVAFARVRLAPLRSRRG